MSECNNDVRTFTLKKTLQHLPDVGYCVVIVVADAFVVVGQGGGSHSSGESLFERAVFRKSSTN